MSDKRAKTCVMSIPFTLRMQATYMRRMRNSNLYIRIACRCYRPQLALIAAHVSEVRRSERA